MLLAANNLIGEVGQFGCNQVWKGYARGRENSVVGACDKRTAATGCLGAYGVPKVTGD